MLAIQGIYENGKLILSEEIKTNKPLKVIITFLEEVPVEAIANIDLSKFSFNESRRILKEFKGSLSDAVIDERRSEF